MEAAICLQGAVSVATWLVVAIMLNVFRPSAIVRDSVAQVVFIPQNP